MPARQARPAAEPAGRSTMKDVAAAAGVGVKTVSRVVNEESGVTAATAARVREAIEALGYRRNDGARLLRQGLRTGSVGLVLEDLADPFYAPLCRAVEEVARRHGSLLFSGSSAQQPQRERDLALAFCARRVDGLILVPTGTDQGYLLPEQAAGTPIVCVDRPACGLVADTVLSANARGAREGIEHLLRQGHRRIGFLGDAPEIHTATERLRGYRAALAAARLPARESWVSMSAPEPARIRLALQRMLAGRWPVSALLCGNNRITVAVLRELAGLPHRPALVGFDDFELADLLTVPVTVVAQDPARLGRTAAELLFARLAGEHGPAQRIELPTRLIPRGSGELPVRYA
ncbi:LacI family transcriptional regulator [Kitasatospora sp. NBC_01250]|uniref:LacI family DNA-binding transcriptional regulator n=1 Tax=unclassified Kitasatospora TaxID=2633591 RepID=UPI002E0E1E2D|nr:MULTISPECIES: LacI family DNA-binding transcriptional regulator [unclassified Kitasatospora]WSJ70650.1 LacI family transcriptional regulator [Kitasatospora sp. NBC_01302]